MFQRRYGVRPMHKNPELPAVRLDLTSMVSLADDKEELLTRIERLFFAGTMSEHMRQNGRLRSGLDSRPRSLADFQKKNVH